MKMFGKLLISLTILSFVTTISYAQHDFRKIKEWMVEDVFVKNSGGDTLDGDYIISNELTMHGDINLYSNLVGSATVPSDIESINEIQCNSIISSGTDVLTIGDSGEFINNMWSNIVTLNPLLSDDTSYIDNAVITASTPMLAVMPSSATPESTTPSEYLEITGVDTSGLVAVSWIKPATGRWYNSDSDKGWINGDAAITMYIYDSTTVRFYNTGTGDVQTKVCVPRLRP